MSIRQGATIRTMRSLGSLDAAQESIPCRESDRAPHCFAVKDHSERGWLPFTYLPPPDPLPGVILPMWLRNLAYRK